VFWGPGFSKYVVVVVVFVKVGCSVFFFLCQIYKRCSFLLSKFVEVCRFWLLCGV
jgi:hypothetical protein